MSSLLSVVAFTFSVTQLTDLVVGQSAETTVIPSAKKSIFATTNATRVNDYINDAFAPLLENGKITQLGYGDFACGTPSKFRFDSGFEIHSPVTPYHESGGFDVEELESYTSLKWDNLISEDGKSNGWYFDAILDNSMTFWVNDLDYFDGYNDDTVGRIYLKWQWNGNTYYSMIIHNNEFTGDLNQFELVSDTFTGIDDVTSLTTHGKQIINSEPRAVFDDTLANYKQLASQSGYYVTSIGIRRAVSDVDRNVEWYKTVFSLTITDDQIITGESIDANGNFVKFAHIIIDTADGFTVSFYERKGDKATFGDFSIGHYETKLDEAHGNIMLNPFCCVDRWYDMHYAIPLNTDVESLSVLKNVMESGEKYIIFLNEIVANLDENSDSDMGRLDVDPRDLVRYHDEEEENNGNDEEAKQKHTNNNIDEYPTVAMFWALVEPNGQMIQIPGIVMYVGNHTTVESGSFIDFFTRPTYWDGTWCPMNNTNSFNEFNFGDNIALIEINYDYFYSINDDSNNDDSNNDNKILKNEKLNTKDKQFLTTKIEFVTVGVIIMIFVGTLILFLIFAQIFAHLKRQQTDNNKSYNTIDSSSTKHNIEYTYKTFQ